MNRAELVEALAAETSMTKAETDRVLNAFLSIVEKNIKKDDGVRLVGFGTFTVAKRKARIGRNPQTGKAIEIAAKNVVKFVPAKALTDALN